MWDKTRLQTGVGHHCDDAARADTDDRKKATVTQLGIASSGASPKHLEAILDAAHRISPIEREVDVECG